ncbi:unnamed protein product [Nezara viridula]|uniref:Uncharacterized protein n=1 Tax=Nezara viridula TaxID=85310 RepID=A0A9P0HII3_NEZVI|nr:unnamed protein product [Nezara viridula]
MCKLYVDDASTERTVQKYFAMFRSGYVILEDTQRCGRPTEIVSSDIKVPIEQDRSPQVLEIPEALKIGFGTVQ